MSERLTIAVPRGALFGGTLDLLDRLGIDTAEVRSNDRKLLFADVGIVTMRPSDVPTYVEHGSADIGITGKDVLLEQSSRKVYELLDLGYGRCEMVVAAPDRGDPIADALRRLGRVRIATKYPRVAAEHFAETGRQAEIVEVKGSVELAPLTGLVDGIVDLTASGQDARGEQPPRDGADRHLHGAADREPGGAQAEGRADRLDPGADAGMRITRIENGFSRAPQPAGRRAGRARDPRRSRRGRRRGRAGVHRALRPRRAGTGAAARGLARAGGVDRRAGAGGARRPAHRDRERARRGSGAAARARPPWSCRRATGWRSQRRRCAARRSTCRAARRPTRRPS